MLSARCGLSQACGATVPSIPYAHGNLDGLKFHRWTCPPFHSPPLRRSRPSCWSNCASASGYCTIPSAPSRLTWIGRATSFCFTASAIRARWGRPCAVSQGSGRGVWRRLATQCADRQVRDCRHRLGLAVRVSEHGAFGGPVLGGAAVPPSAGAVGAEGGLGSEAVSRPSVQPAGSTPCCLQSARWSLTACSNSVRSPATVCP